MYGSFTKIKIFNFSNQNLPKGFDFDLHHTILNLITSSKIVCILPYLKPKIRFILKEHDALY